MFSNGEKKLTVKCNFKLFSKNLLAHAKIQGVKKNPT